MVCDFCGKRPPEGELIVAAPGGQVHICESCVFVCQRVIEEEKQKCSGAAG
ncbi:ClpX C4-type zinc finger protein [Tautonia marina]|uniref:ClpX C4-type zinc finger protein n=1 Tax=Tautonia marina TaxID=2653855 RepID=UPI0036F3C3F0